jgi:hypothetical protein
MLIWIKNSFHLIVLILIYNRKDLIMEIIQIIQIIQTLNILIFKKEDLVTKMI